MDFDGVGMWVYCFFDLCLVVEVIVGLGVVCFEFFDCVFEVDFFFGCFCVGIEVDYVIVDCDGFWFVFYDQYGVVFVVQLQQQFVYLLDVVWVQFDGWFIEYVGYVGQ